ncbi:Transmembrane protein 53 [Colletotrichum chlorophyti]|uniref:Transmembrane protein 53 n=1 Tax=Colletotrichum chlorophyti TaxID=708187 RepID=A0A1Q8RPG0_9PEZI|nr:Transmembrane protein 53 [Colletotrichum chlorophyti]
MASNQLTGSAGPLPAMEELSPTTFLYDPPSAARDPNSPKLIAIFSWMSAQDTHIAKYTSRYMALYPSASILLVKCPFIHTLSSRISRRQIKPAVPIIRALADSTPHSEVRPQLLLHVFSNGGATNFAKFLDMYVDADRAGRLALPPHVTLYDSCPGTFHWMRSYRALSSSLPRVLAPLAHVLIGWFWLLHVPLGRVGFFGKMWAALRQKALLASEKGRAYLYSKEDEMIYWGDVERHAAEAREVGFKVRQERFVGSPHVAHARLDGERYWGTVKELWDEGERKKNEPPKDEPPRDEPTKDVSTTDVSTNDDLTNDTASNDTSSKDILSNNARPKETKSEDVRSQNTTSKDMETSPKDLLPNGAPSKDTPPGNTPPKPSPPKVAPIPPPTIQ